jgi:hypothetical protein
MMLLSWLPLMNRRPGPARSLSRQRRRPKIEQLEDRFVPTGLDAVMFWNQVALQATVVDNGVDAPRLQIGPTRASRVLAIESLAVFDAVNSITHTYTPYLTSVEAPRGASIEAAASVAAYETLTAMYPYQEHTFLADMFHSMADIPIIPALEGAAVGHIVAQRMLAARANDGSDNNTPYTYGQLPGQWRADPIRMPTVDPLGPNWGGVTPFALQSADEFMPPPPPDLTSLLYAQNYEVTKDYGTLFSTIRTDDQTETGVFWGYDAQPYVCAPVRLYNQITEAVSIQEGLTEVQNARLFALVNMTMADGAIAAWNDKYTYNFWRPVTAIRENDPGTGPSGLGSGNPYLYNPDQGIDEGDPNWGPFGAPAHDGYGNFTPPFPSYTSGHAVIGGSMLAILTDFFQTNNLQFTVTTDDFNTQAENQYGDILDLQPRTFAHFSDAADENAQSRIYLGIHFDFDKEQGVAEGYRIADYDFNNELQPLHGQQTGIADNILNTVLAPQMANDFANELATIGFNPSTAGRTAGAAALTIGVPTSGVAVVAPANLGLQTNSPSNSVVTQMAGEQTDGSHTFATPSSSANPGAVDTSQLVGAHQSVPIQGGNLAFDQTLNSPELLEPLSQ